VTFSRKLLDHRAHVGIVGLGYVGLPLALEFSRAGFPVVGIDLDESKVRGIEKGRSYIGDVASAALKDAVSAGRLSATTSFDVIRDLDCVLICVPTPLRKTRDPDISFIVSAVDEIAERLHPGMLVVLESTTYPGTTEEVILPRLEATGLKVGRDFHLAFSPERVDPGNRVYQTHNTPKVVGGVTASCGRIARILYEQAIENVVTVSSSRSAEMVKLLENTFRSVNIALVNEIALMCNRLDLEVWEVIDAAATKPFGFMPFYPGPGLGGHCIPIDPHYLSWKLKTLNYQARFIELASEINSFMPEYVVTKIVDGLNDHRKSVKGSQILLVGVAYKRDTSDTRESPALDLYRLLSRRGARVSVTDSFVRRVRIDGGMVRSTALTPDLLKKQDCVVIVTDHSDVDYQSVVDHSRLVVDTRNATKGVRRNRRRVIKL
jgi:UDP-N-acetyl-D-glucosamine dehydrogenase